MNPLSPQIPCHLLELVNDVVWTASLDGHTLLYANPALEQVYGRPATDFYANMGLWLEAVHPDDRAIAEQSGRELLADGHSEAIYRIVRPDGVVRWLLDCKHVINDDRGQPHHLGGIAADITTQKQTELALRENEARFRAVLANNSIVVFDQDEALRYTRIYNPNANFTVERVIGQTDADLLSATDAAQLTAIKRRVLATGTGERQEVQTTAGGEEFYYDLTVEPKRAETGQITGVTCAAMDITKRKQAEADLRASEARYRQIFETNTAIKLVIDPADGRVIEANQSACEFYGYDYTTLTAMKITDINILPPNKVQQEMERARALNRLFFNFPHRLASGEIRDVEVYSSPIEINGKTLLYSIIHDATERKRTEVALRDREERLGMIITGANLGTWDWDIATGQVTFNERWAEMLEYNLTEIEPHVSTWEKLLHPDDAPTVMFVLNKHLAGQTAYYQTEHRMLAKSGEWKWILDTGKVLQRDEQGRPLRATGTHLDITDRIKAEQALRHSERKFRSVIEQSPDAIFLTDETGQIIEWNPAAEQLTGMSKTNLLGQMIWDIRYRVSPHQTPAVYEQIKTGLQHLLKTGENPQKNKLVELPIQTATGQPKEIQSAVFTIKTDSGNMMGNIIRDITAQKQIEQNLRDSEEKYRALFDNELYAIAIFDLDTLRFLDVNEAFIRLYGYSRTELLFGITAHQFVVEVDQAMALFQQIAKEGTYFVPLRHHRKKDGTIFPVEVVGGVYTWRGRRVWFSIVHDITARVTSEIALQESERKFRGVIEKSADAIILIDETGRLIEWNPAAEQIIGQTQSEILGKLLWDQLFRLLPSNLQTPDRYEQLKTEWQTYFKTGQHPSLNQPVEVNICRPDGATRQIQSTRFSVPTERGFLLGAIVRDVTAQKQAQAEREQLISQLQATLAQVKQLSGMLPICANCKKIRDDDGYWQDVAVYIRDHSEAEFSHGLCPDCVKKLYPEIYSQLYPEE